MVWILVVILFPYLYLLIKIYSGLLKIRPYHPSSNTLVFVSVIVACRNEEKRIQGLLDNLSSQDYAEDSFEVIIIDDNSTDNTFKSALSYSRIPNLRVLKNYGEGKKKALRTGIETSAGSLILTTDADCTIGNRWISTIVSFYLENVPDLIIGPVIYDYHKGIFSRFQELEFLSLQGVTSGTAANQDAVMCNGANLAFRKETYNKHSADMHDEIISGDDVFLLHNIKKESGSIMWLESQNAIITTQPVSSIGSFLRQRARWLSKSGSYSDSYTRILAIVTFVTVLFQTAVLIAGFFNVVLLKIFIAGFLLKSIPDFLILLNMTRKYKKKNLLWFFIPSQFLYPFYILSVLVFYIFTKADYFRANKE